ncbi:LamG domain-containing protein [Flavobacteriales bacterium]|nr:LamG domain-containing protein [Flavobacteriales bacterium]
MKQLILLIATTTFLAATALAQAPFNVPDNIGAGNCLEFDGTNDFVGCGDFTDNLFDGVATKLTAEAWIKIDNVVGKHTIMGKYNNFIDDRVFLVRVLSGGKIDLFSGKNTDLDYRIATTDNNVIVSGVWTHVVTIIDLDNQQMHFYINGVEELNTIAASGSWASVIQDGSPDFEIGVHRSAGGATQYFDGQIDEVRLWNVVRTEQEIRDNMNKKLVGNEIGLIGYWPMNEGADNTCAGGEDVCDQSGNGNHGTLEP